MASYDFKDFENFYKATINQYEDEGDYISPSPSSSYTTPTYKTQAYNTISRLQYNNKPQTLTGKYMLNDYKYNQQQLEQQRIEESKPANRIWYNELFDLLQIGQYTVMGGLSGMADGRGGLNPFVGMAKGFTQGLSIIPGWEGWKEPADYQAGRDVLPHLGWEKEENPDGVWYNPSTWNNNNVSQSIAGFILDVALDPATYFTGGVGALLKGSTGIAPDVATKIGANLSADVASKAGANIAGDVATKFGDDVAEIISKGMSNDEALDAIARVVNKKGLSHQMAEEIVKRTYVKRGVELTQDVLQKEADMVYKKVNNLLGRSTVEKPLAWGLPGMAKKEIISDATLRRIGDKFKLSKPVNKIIDSFYTSPVGKAFSNKTGLRALAKQNPAKIYEFFSTVSYLSRDAKSTMLKKPEFIQDFVERIFGDATPKQIENVTKALDSKRSIKYINKITKEVYGSVDDAVSKDPWLKSKVDDYIGKKKKDIDDITEEVGIMKQQKEAIQKEMDDLRTAGSTQNVVKDAPATRKLDTIQDVVKDTPATSKKAYRDMMDYAHVEEDFINTLEYVNKNFKRPPTQQSAMKSVFDKRVNVEEVINKVNKNAKVEDMYLVKKAINKYDAKQYSKYAKGARKPKYSNITTGEKIFASKGSGEIDELSKIADKIFDDGITITDTLSDVVKRKRQNLIDAINNSIFGGEKIIDSELFGYNIDSILEIVNKDIKKISTKSDIENLARKLINFKNHSLKQQAIYQYIGRDLNYKNILKDRVNVFEKISKELPPVAKTSPEFKRLERLFNASKQVLDGKKVKSRTLSDKNIIYGVNSLYDIFIKNTADDSLKQFVDEKMLLFNKRIDKIDELMAMPDDIFWKEFEKISNETLTGVKFKYDYDAINKTYSDMNRTIDELKHGDIGVRKKSSDNLRGGDFVKEDYAELKKWYTQNEAKKQAWLERQELLKSQETILTPSDYNKMIDLQKQGYKWEDILKTMKGKDKTFNVTEEAFNARTKTLNELFDIKTKLKQVDSRFKAYKKQISYVEKSSLRGIDSELKEIDNMLKEYQKQLSIAEKAGKSTDDIFSELDTLADLQDDLLAKRDKLVSSGYKDTDKAKPFLDALDDLANMQDNLLARQEEITKALPTDSDKLVNPKNFYESKNISINTGGYKKASQRVGYAGTLDDTGADYIQQLASREVDEIPTSTLGKKTYNEINPRYADLPKAERVAKNLEELKKIDSKYYSFWKYKNGKLIPSDLQKKMLQSYKGKIDLQMSKITNKEFKSLSDVKKWIKDLDIKNAQFNDLQSRIKRLVSEGSEESRIAYLRKQRDKLYRDVTDSVTTSNKDVIDSTIKKVNEIIDESYKFSDEMQDVVTKRNQIKDYIKGDIDTPPPPRSSKIRNVKIGDDVISQGWSAVKENVTGDGWELLIKANEVDSRLINKYKFKRVGDKIKVPYEMTNIVRNKSVVSDYKSLYSALTDVSASKNYYTTDSRFQSALKRLEANKNSMLEIRDEVVAKRAESYAKNIVDNEKVTKATQQIVEESKKFDNELEKALFSSFDEKGYSELQNKMNDVVSKIEDLSSKKLALEKEITDDNIEKAIKQLFNEDDYIKEVDGLDNVENAMYKRFRKQFDNMARQEVELGLLTDSQRKIMQDQYLPHILTKEGLDMLQKGDPLFDEFMGREARFAFGRTRRASKGKTIFDFNNRAGVEAFSEDLASIYLVRALKSQKAVYDETFMRTMANNLGDDFISSGVKKSLKTDHTITTTYGQLNRSLSNYAKDRMSIINRTIKSGEDINKLSPELAERLAMSETTEQFLSSEYDRIINEVMDEVGLPLKNKDAWNKPLIELTDEQATKLKHYLNMDTKQVHNAIVEKMNLAKDVEIFANSNALLKTYDKYLKLYKANLTSIYPGFHARNAVSNQFLNFLGIGSDVLNPTLQKNATLALTDLNKVKREVLTDEYTWGRVVELAEQEGIIKKGFFDTDIANKTDLEKVGMRMQDGISYLDNAPGNWNPLDLKGFVPYQKGTAVGSFVEGRDRLVHFAGRLKKGDTVEEAVESVNKFLFDYSDLTKFEHTVMKRLVPFYTWMRKNTALQAEMLIERPEVYRNLDKIHNMIEGGVSDEEMIDKSTLPDYMQDYLQITPNTLFNPNMPYQDLNISKNIDTNALTPAVKLPLQVMSGRVNSINDVVSQHPWRSATNVFSADTPSVKVQRILKLLGGLSFTDVEKAE